MSNEDKPKLYTTFFTLCMFLSTGFSILATIISLYGPGTGGCRLGFVVAPVVLQAIGVIIGLITFLVGCGKWISSCLAKQRKNERSTEATQAAPSATSSISITQELHLTRRSIPILLKRPSEIGSIAGLVQVIGSVASLVMLVLVSVTKDGCTNSYYTIISSICGSGISFISAFIALFLEKELSRRLPYRIKLIDGDRYHIIPSLSNTCIRFIEKDQFKIFTVRAGQCHENKRIPCPPSGMPVGLIYPKIRIIPFIDRPYCY
jgi:hypothetical protein